MSHHIRLHGFWEGVALPGGITRWTRKFGLPRTTDDSESIWLSATKLPSKCKVYLNSEYLGEFAETGFEIEVTGKLEFRNEVVLELTGEVSEILLVIRPETERSHG